MSAAKKTFVFDIRKAVGRKKPVHDVNGVIKGRYAAIIVPSSGQTIVIPNLSLSVEETYDTQDGGKLSYKGHALEPFEGGSLVREATSNLTAALAGITQTIGVAFTPKAPIATLVAEAELAVFK